MEQYLLSIIIPHYNIPELLEKLLNSIPRREEIQILVIDDQSDQQTDKLRHVIDKYSDRNLEFYQNETGHNSAGTCRNIGLDRAQGQWVIFADADDYFVDGWFEKLEPFFVSDNDLVYYSITSAYLETGETAKRHLHVETITRDYCDNPSHDNEIRLRYGSPAAWHTLYRRAFLNEVNARFDNLRTEEDKMFVLTCGLNAKKFACIPDALYCLTQREGSLTTEIGFERFDRHQRMVIRRCSILYRELDKSDILALDLDSVGLQILYTTIMEHYGVRQAMVYRRLEKENGIPLVLHFEPVKLMKKMIHSMKDRMKD